MDECLSSPCDHASSCWDKIGYFICECQGGYDGDLCENGEIYNCNL